MDLTVSIRQSRLYRRSHVLCDFVDSGRSMWSTIGTVVHGDIISGKKGQSSTHSSKVSFTMLGFPEKRVVSFSDRKRSVFENRRPPLPRCLHPLGRRSALRHCRSCRSSRWRGSVSSQKGSRFTLSGCGGEGEQFLRPCGISRF